MADEASIKTRVERVRRLAHENAQTHEFYEAASIAQSVIHDTVGGGHPLMRALEEAVKSSEWWKILGACKGVLALYDEGALPSPTLRIAHEIEGGVLDIAQTQAQAAETAMDVTAKQLGLAIAAFLAGAALEDALRRLCDANGLAYDSQRSTIAKLQAVLYQPAKNIEVISQSENKQITPWGDTRNKADHGKFSEITQTEVVTMIIGVRAFIDKHLP
jgi:hypothetical protein